MSARARKTLRVIWVPVVAALAAALLAVAADRTPAAHEASALLVVPASSPESTPEPGATSVTVDLLGRPSEAQRLAGTYATLIPADEATIAEVAEAMGTDEAELRGDVSAVAVLDSSLVRVTVRASAPEAATAGITALAGALTGPAPASPAIARGSLVLVSTDEPSAVGGLPAGAVPAAALAGALLGAFAAVAWTRQDRRVDSVSDLDPLDLPAIELDTIDRRSARAAVSGVLVASGLDLGDDLPVHLLAAGTSSDAPTARIAAVLPSRLGQVGPPRNCVGREDEALVLGPAVYYGGVVTTAPSPTALTEPGTAVVVARRGIRLTDVARTVATVERFGSVVAGVLVCARPAGAGHGSASRSAVDARSGAAGHGGGDDSVEAADGAEPPEVLRRPRGGSDLVADAGVEATGVERSSTAT